MRNLRADLEPLELMRLAPAAGVMVVWAVLMFMSGGFQPSAWLPAGFVLLALLVLAIIGNGRLLPAPGRARNALLVLAAFTAWCFVSILWSDARGDTLEAADLLLVALLAAWTLALSPWRAKTAWILLMAFSVAAGAACLVALMSALGATDLTGRFEDLRFSPPLDYPNTTAAFALLAAIPALLQAARPDSSIPAKAFGQGLAMFLAGYALLPQSRGAVLGGLAAVVVLSIAVSFRWRLLMHAAVLAVGLVAVSGPAGDVYEAAATTGSVSDALSSAATALLAVTLFAGLAGAGLAYAQNRIQIDDDGRHTARRAGFALTGVFVVVVLAAGVVKANAISDAVSDQWRSLKNPGVEFSGRVANEGSGRLTSIDPLERYDYWRVSVNGFRGAPLWGMGAGAFEHDYTVERRYSKVTRYPHNLALKVLGDTGLVGIGLIVAFLVIATAGLLRARRSASRTERVVAAAALTMLAYYVAHGAFDWLEAYPVLTGPALAFPIVALVAVQRGHRLRSPAGPRTAPPPTRAFSLPETAGALAVIALAAIALLLPWLALRYSDRAKEIWRADPAAAYRDLDRAASINALDDDAALLKGVIGLTRGDLTGARAGFTQAIDREQDWLPHFGLAVIAAAQDDDATARRELDTAQRLNPRDPQLAELAPRVLAQKQGDTPARLIRDVLVSPLFEVETLK